MDANCAKLLDLQFLLLLKVEISCYLLQIVE